MNIPSQVSDSPVIGPSEPDFLCVGMEKAATNWLFDQLRMHPDFWIPPVKEIGYLHAATPRMDSTVNLLARERQWSRKILSEADKEFLLEAEELAGQPRDIEKYAALFRFKGYRISGDIGPRYCVLGGETIAAIGARFPSLKAILMVRDPVERVWSLICQRHRIGKFDEGLLADTSRFAEWFEHSPLKRTASATRVLRRWAEHAPLIAFRYYFFDDVIATPASVRSEVITFLGGDPKKPSGELPPNYNHKAGASKLALPDDIKSVLVEQLAEEVLACARLFGGPAERWPAAHGF